MIMSWPIRPYWWRSALPEVGSERVEIGGIDHVVGAEVGAVVVAGLAGRQPKGASQDGKVARVDRVIVVGVARPLKAHLGTGHGVAGKIEAAGGRQVFGAFGPPCVRAVGQTGHADREEPARVGALARIIYLDGA